MSEHIVTVVVPMFNPELSHILDLCHSLIGELEGKDRVIWVDDGSSNLVTYYWLREGYNCDERHLFSRFSYNQGVAAAMNMGIDLAPNDSYIITMGSDDIFIPGYIASARKILDANSEVDVIVPGLEFFGERQGTVHPLPTHLSLFTLFRHNKMLASSIFRKQLWKKLGGFDHNLSMHCEDWDFWFRAACRGATFYRLEQTGYRYRARQGSLTSEIDLKKARRRLWRKWLLPLLKTIFTNGLKQKGTVRILGTKVLL